MFDVDPDETYESYPCECGGVIRKNEGGGEWECDSCEFTAEVEDE